ncbi:ABC transporter ATP-binding protein [Rhodobacteraceae bacterium NNCM2]|nr:ABC transporter ATP-binding protein [Coraliihabitans acroporae]
MFRFFETLIDPYQPYDEDAELPGGLVGFYRVMLWPARKLIAISLVLGGIFAIAEAALIRYAGQLVDVLSDTKPDELWAQHGDLLWWMIVVALLIRPIVLILDNLVMTQGFYAPMGALIRWRTHRKMLRQSLGFFTDDFAGRIANKQIQLAPALNDSVHQMIEAIWYSGIYVIGVAVVLGETDARLLIPFGLWFAGFIAVAIWFVPTVTARGKEVAEARSTLAGRIVDSYANIQTVKLFAHGREEEEYARAAMEDFRWVFHRQARVFTVLTVYLMGLQIILLAGVIGYAIYLWSVAAITVGAVSAATALVLRMLGMMDWIMWTLSILFQNIGTVQEGIETVSKPLRLKDKPDARELRLTDGAVRMEGITHRYGGRAGGVSNIDLEIDGGERVGLVGSSGAGKSTFVNLALRFFDPDEGRVLIDGQNLAEMTQDSVRRQISMVTQETALLHRSIRDNIRYGKPEATDEEVWKAASLVSADQFIPDLVDQHGRTGMDAHVGERGVRLSGGQRQRIALARAVLKDAPILILDEATSALDSEVEAAIQGELQHLMAGKTVIAIAHRLSTIQRMDRIVVLEQGRIAEQGTHEELLSHGGLYARFWSHQSGGMIGVEAAE